MISNKIEKLLNEQYNMELFASNAYLSIASYFTDEDLDGMAQFFMVQSKEESAHAEKFFKYIHDAGGKVEMEAIAKPTTKFKSVKQVFEAALTQEKGVTASINKIVKQALGESDYTTHAFLTWFLTEQVEEEAIISNIIKKIERVGDNKSALFLIDNELGKRTFVEGEA
ncbi:MAG: ferritin [Sphingobacteriales bacterium]|jgi:ferritin